MYSHHWDVRAHPWNPEKLSIRRSVCTAINGMSRDILGILGFLVFGDQHVLPPLGRPKMPLESQDTWYFVGRDTWSASIGISWDMH